MMTKKILVAALAAAVLGPLWASTAQAGLRSTYQHRYQAVKHRHGVRAPGRNIVKYGMRNGRQATNHEIAVSARTLKRMLTVVHEPVYAAPAAAPATPAVTPPGDGIGGVAAPSGGGGCGGGFRGLYQFDCQTWRSVGGSGDPAAASPAEQRRRAEILQGQRGNQPWPVCGQGGASLDQIAQCESGGNPGAVG